MDTKSLIESLKIIYSILNRSPLNYKDSAIDELKLFDIEHTEDDVYLLGALARDSKNLKVTLNKVKSLNPSELDHLISDEKKFLSKETNIEKLKAELNNQRETLKKLETTIDKLSKYLESTATKQDFQDYYVIARVSDDVAVMRAPISKAMRKGWVPIGGINTTFNSVNQVFLFCQTMALPVGKSATNPE